MYKKNLNSIRKLNMFPGQADIEKIGVLLNAAITADNLKPLVSSGLTHDHIVIGDSGWLLRVPRNNQLGLSPDDYLLQQKACYDEAEKSGVTPACLGIIAPSDDLPNGALIIQYIRGRRVNSENDLPAVARCLAALSSVQPDSRSSIQTASAPFASQWFVIQDAFGKYFDSPAVDSKVRDLLKQEKDALEKEFAQLNGKQAAVGMIGGDSHLANYLIDTDGKAWFVDLEFLTFDVPAIDAADAVSDLTLRLDPKNTFPISSAARENFYKTWLENVPDRSAQEASITLAERTIALRTLAWMCYWADQGKQDNKPNTESRNNWNKLCSETLTVEKVAAILNVTGRKLGTTRPQPPQL